MAQTAERYDGQRKLFPPGLVIHVDIDGLEVRVSKDSPDSRTSIDRTNVNPSMSYDAETNTLTLSDPAGSGTPFDDAGGPFRFDDDGLALGGSHGAGTVRIRGIGQIGDIAAGDIHHGPGTGSATRIIVPPGGNRRIEIVTADSTRVASGRTAVLADLRRGEQRVRHATPAPSAPSFPAPAPLPSGQRSWGVSGYQASVLSQEMYPKGEFFSFASGDVKPEPSIPTGVASQTIDGHTLASLTYQHVRRFGFDFAKRGHFADRGELVEAMEAFLSQPQTDVFANLVTHAAAAGVLEGPASSDAKEGALKVAKGAATSVEDGLIKYGIIEVLAAQDREDPHVDALVRDPTRPVDRRHLRALGLRRILRDGLSPAALQQMRDTGTTDRVKASIVEGLNQGRDALGIGRVSAEQLGLDTVFSSDYSGSARPPHVAGYHAAEPSGQDPGRYRNPPSTTRDLPGGFAL